MKPSRLFTAIGKLNTLKHRQRRGWVVRGVKGAESVADHAWRSAVIAHLIAPKGYDRQKMLLMALLHDTSDIYGPHYIPTDYITKENKFSQERKSMKRFVQLLPGNEGEKWLGLWEEMENQSSKEAKLVKDAEILDMLFQALEYQKAGNFKKDLTEFWARDIKRLTTPPGKKLGLEISRQWPKAAKKRFDAKKYTYHY
ncbi:MAG: HD domain-containing protein [Candidatus Diapherotrites archaeon]|nr:HD domain-containing protein [Candidatus Diapherotrites archaeon]